MTLHDDVPFAELRTYYSTHFGLGYINGNSERSSIETKFILISLICFITKHAKEKNPDITYYRVIYKLCENLGIPDSFIKALAIICEDFAYGCTEFPTFGLKGNDIVKETKNILNTYMPF